MPLRLSPFATRPTRTPPRPHLLTAAGRCDAGAVMRLAHYLARDDVADAARRGRVRRYRIALRDALTSAWSTAQTQRWCRERDATMAALPASHAAILAERTAALMIDSDPPHGGRAGRHRRPRRRPGVPAVTARDRRIAGLTPWADARPQYRLKLGPLLIGFDALTDDALDALRSRIAGDVRRERSRGAR